MCHLIENNLCQAYNDREKKALVKTERLITSYAR